MILDAALALSAVTRPLVAAVSAVLLAVAGATRVLPVAVIGASVLAHALKPLIGRERPEFAHVVENTSAMPSAHATAAAAFATVLTLWLWPRGGWWRGLVAASWASAAAVGAARVVLGVHWVSDVLVGFLLGAAVAAVCWRVA